MTACISVEYFTCECTVQLSAEGMEMWRLVERVRSSAGSTDLRHVTVEVPTFLGICVSRRCVRANWSVGLRRPSAAL